MELLQLRKVIGSISPDNMRELLLFTHLLGNKNRSDARVPAARLHDDLSIIAFLLITMLLICILAIAMFVFTGTRT